MNGADASSAQPIVDMARPAPPPSRRYLTTGANTNAPAALALVISPVLSPSPKGARDAICTERPYPTPDAAPNTTPYPRNNGAALTYAMDCDAINKPAPAHTAAPVPMTAGAATAYSHGPSLATATVKQMVAREKTPESKPRPTPSACSSGTR